MGDVTDKDKEIRQTHAPIIIVYGIKKSEVNVTV